MAKKILKKILSTAKKLKAKKQPSKAKAVVKEEVMPALKKKRSSEKILTAEGWKRLLEKERKPALKKS